MNYSKYLSVFILAITPTLVLAQTECNYFSNSNESGLSAGSAAANGFNLDN